MRMLANCTNGWVVAILLLGTAVGQPVLDLSGNWIISTTATLPDFKVPCQFHGSTMLSQAGAEITATIGLNLATGPEVCPPEMSAALTAFLGDMITGTLEGGQMFGTAVLTGTISASTRSIAGEITFPKDEGDRLLAANGGSSGSGGFSTTAGPFAGVGGSWVANQELDQFAPVPTLGEFGIMILVALLLISGVMAMRRRPA